MEADENYDRRLLEAVFNNASVALFVMNELQHCIYMNPAAVELTGYTSQEVAGKPLHDVLHHTRPDGSPYPLHECPIDRALPNNTRVQGEEVFVHKDGHFYYVAFTASPFPLNDRLIGTVIEVQDITERKRADEVRQASQQYIKETQVQAESDRHQLDAILESAPVGIVVADKDGRPLRANAAYEKLWGAPPHGVHGRATHYGSCWWADGSSRHGQKLKPEEWVLTRAANGETIQGDIIEIEPFDAPGTRRILINSGAPVRDAQGRVMGGVSAKMDITDRMAANKALQESEQRYRQMADAMPQLVWAADAEGNIDYYSARVDRYQGFDLSENGRWNWVAALHPEDAEQTVTAWAQSVRSGKRFEVEHRLRMLDGQYRWHLTLAESAMNDEGQVVRWFGSATDIHDRKEAESRLRALNDELEEFAYVASHDLQEPLRKVSLYTQLLLDKFECDKDEETQIYAEHIQAGVKRMHALIQDLLNHSRSVHHPKDLDAQVANLEVSLKDAMQVLDTKIAESHARIEAEPLPEVAADPGQMSLVFQNLIANALKYQPAGQQPQIRINAEPEAEHWLIRVVDNGIGFAPEYAARIFGLFKRLHKHEYPGTGLGLAICKRIVERYSGQIWADSAGEGKGACFYIRLPRVEEALVASELESFTG